MCALTAQTVVFLFMMRD